jgi:hypothetical protein
MVEWHHVWMTRHGSPYLGGHFVILYDASARHSLFLFSFDFFQCHRFGVFLFERKGKTSTESLDGVTSRTK